MKDNDLVESFCKKYNSKIDKKMLLRLIAEFKNVQLDYLKLLQNFIYNSNYPVDSPVFHLLKDFTNHMVNLEVANRTNYILKTKER